MLRVVTTDAPTPRIRDLLDGDPRGLLFLQPRWLDALTRAFPRFRPCHVLAEADGEIAAVLPLVEIRKAGAMEIVSLPFGSYGGPVLAPGADPEAVRPLIREFVRRTHGSRVFRHELTLFEPVEAVARIVEEEMGERRVPTQTWIIDLDRGREALWESYEGRARTAVRKAQKDGVTARIETGPEAVDAFYVVHRAQGKTRPIPWHHRREALGTIADILGEDAAIWIARHEGRAVCGALVLTRPGCEAHPWVTGALPESRPLNAFPLLMHLAMEHAADRGCRRWNFGPSAGSEKVEYFKTAFGGSPQPILRYHHEAWWVPWARRIAL
jgi:hypothetical protein